MKRARTDRGFTLIEIMIAVAIIGILATTAISSWNRYQLRSKRSEAFLNLKSLAVVQDSYFAETGIYAGAIAMPGPVPNPVGRQWTPAAELAFQTVGWRPEGIVYYDYDVNVPGGPAIVPCPCPECFTASAYGDTDGDGMLSVVMYVQPDRMGGFCPASVTGDPVPINTLGNPVFDAPAVSNTADNF